MLNEEEVTDIMRKEVPALLHKRIAELELALSSVIEIMINREYGATELTEVIKAADDAQKIIDGGYHG